jgi:hypothetical protein
MSSHAIRLIVAHEASSISKLWLGLRKAICKHPTDDVEKKKAASSHWMTCTVQCYPQYRGSLTDNQSASRNPLHTFHRLRTPSCLREFNHDNVDCNADGDIPSLVWTSL